MSQDEYSLFQLQKEVAKILQKHLTKEAQKEISQAFKRKGLKASKYSWYVKFEKKIPYTKKGLAEFYELAAKVEQYPGEARTHYALVESDGDPQKAVELILKDHLESLFDESWLPLRVGEWLEDPLINSDGYEDLCTVLLEYAGKLHTVVEKFIEQATIPSEDQYENRTIQELSDRLLELFNEWKKND